MSKFSYIHILKGEIMYSKENLEHLSYMFDMLGDISRLSIVVHLLKGKKNVTEIVNLVGMSQSAVSHQLRILKDAQILKREKVGKTVYYSIADNHVETIVKNGLVHMTHGEDHEEKL